MPTLKRFIKSQEELPKFLIPYLDEVSEISLDTPVDRALYIMKTEHADFLRIGDGQQVYGYISFRDLADGLLSEKEFLIAQLYQYITGAIQAPTFAEN